MHLISQIPAYVWGHQLPQKSKSIYFQERMLKEQKKRLIEL